MRRPSDYERAFNDRVTPVTAASYFNAVTSAWSGPMRIYNSVPENNCIGCGAPKKQHFGCEYCGRE